MATALDHLTRLEQQRFTGLKGLPVLVGGDQGIEGAPLGKLGGAVVQLLKHRSRVAGIDPALIKPSVR